MQGKAYTLATRLFPHSCNNNRPHGRRRRDAGPSAPDQTDGRTPGHNNIYRASIAPRGKKNSYISVWVIQSLR